MAKLQTSLDITVPFRPAPIPRTDTGVAEMWASIASTSARFTQQISQLADKAAIKEGELAGLAYGSEAGLPGGRFPSAPAAAKPMKLTGDQKARQGEAMNYFTSQGWSREQAAGIVGNLMQESSLHSGAYGDRTIPGGSVGLGQWNRERQANLKKFASSQGKSWQDFGTQLAFVQHELSTSEVGAARKLKAAKTVDDATSAFIGFERPAGWTPENPRAGHGFRNRLSYAQAVFSSAHALPASDTAGAAPPAAVPTAAGLRGNEPAATFQLTRSYSLRGQAFDRAAAGTYADRMETKALVDIEKIATATPDDPAAIEANLEEYRQSVVSQLPLELRPGFTAMVARQGIAYKRQASVQHQKKLDDEAESSFLTNYETKRRNLIQMASRAGLDDEGNGLIAVELTHLNDYIAGAQGLTPRETAKLQGELRDDVTTARMLAQFENIPDAGGRATFAKTFKATWAEGKGEAKDLSPEAFNRIDAQMSQVLARDETAALKKTYALERQVNGVLARVKEGFAIPETERAALKAQVAAIADPELAAQWQFFESMANWQAVNRHATPEQINAQIEAYSLNAAKVGATANDVVALDAMRGLHKAAVDGLDKDQLGWAEQAGRIVVEPLDFTSEESLGLSLSMRAADAHAVAQSYGRPPVFFRPEEKAKLTQAMADNPDLMINFVPTLRKSLGDRDTPKALAEISKDAPVLAHVAGLAMATGDDTFLRETATALKMTHVENHEPVKMPENIRPANPALAFLPKLDAATTKTAELVFDLRARHAGLDPATDPEGAKNLWGAIVNEALGAREVNGQTVGGLAEINGFSTLLPPDMSQADLQARLDGITDAALADLPPIKTFNGFKVHAADVATGKLVPDGMGRYRVALGDPASEDPRYLMGENGGFWILDATRLKPSFSEADVPALVMP